MSSVFSPLHWQAALLNVGTAAQLGAAHVQRLQQQRLALLLQAAQGASPLYRALLGAAPITVANAPARLAQLPPLGRHALMACFDDWVCDRALRLDDLRAFTADPARIAQPWLGQYVVWESSGSSGGAPGVFVQDAPALAVYDALELLRHRIPPKAAGLPGLPAAMVLWRTLGSAERSALVTATGGHFSSVVGFERLRRLNPWLARHARLFSLMQPLEALVQSLNAFAPQLLATYPSAALLLAQEAEAGRLRIRPSLVLTGGETLTPTARQRMARAFGAPVRNSYGASECMAMGWECAHGHLHLSQDWVLLEPVDAQGRPVPPGTLSQRVWLTNLANRVQPLIRYELDDQVLIHPEPCACGSPMPVMQVHGRSDDVLHVPAARKGQYVSLLPLALSTVLEEEAGLFDFQLLQRDARAATARARQALQAFAQAQGAADLRIVGELDQPLQRSRSGKLKRIVAWHVD